MSAVAPVVPQGYQLDKGASTQTSSVQLPQGYQLDDKFNTNPALVTQQTPQAGIGSIPTNKEALDIGADALPIFGAEIGSLAGPEGTMIGSGIGGIAARSMHRSFNADNKIPQAPETPIGVANEFLSNAALGGAAEAIPPVVGQKLRSGGQYLADLLFKGGGRVNEEAVAAAINAGLKPTTAQATGSPIANILENALAGKARIAREIEQTGKLNLNLDNLNRELSGQPQIGPRNSPSTATTGKLAQQAVKGNLEIASNIEKKAYDNFEKTHLANNTQNFNVITGYEESPVVGADGKPLMRPVVEQRTTVGPIYTPNSTAFASQIKPQLDAFTKGETYQVLPDFQKSKVNALKQTVDNLAQGTNILDQSGKEISLPMKDYQTVKQMITNLNDSVGSVVDPNLQQGGLQKLASLLDKDRDLSISNWKNGASATADLEKAKAATTYRKQTFNNEVTNKVFNSEDRRLPADASQFFSEAYQSPEKAQRLMKAMGPENTKYIKGDYFDSQITPKLFDPASGKFTPDNLVRELNDPNSVTRSIYNADERSAMLDFARSAQAVAPKGGGFGQYALAFHNGRMLLHIGSALGGALVGQSTGHALMGAGAGLALEAGARDFAQNILLNPSYARNASRLLKVPADSAEGIARSKLMLAGLKGTQILLNRNDGSTQSGTITEGGKVKLDSQ